MIPADITKVPHTLLLADDSATIQYDAQRTTCEGIAETVRALGFSVRSYECEVQP